MRHVLFLCVFNATRSIMAEALLNHLGKGKFRAHSAGDYRARQIHPLTLECLAAHGIPPEGLHSKTWELFIGLGAPRIDYIITVCDDSQEKPHDKWPPFTMPVKVHWNTANPASVQGSPEQIRSAFEAVYQRLARRIEALVALPLDGMDRSVQWQEISRFDEIR
jgi:arsenate reductase